MKRWQEKQILKDLTKKMVFVVGPRQVGKTWLSKKIATNFQKSCYLNYDQLEDKQIMKEQSWLPETELLILDELHKMSDWKNYLKGLFDTKSENLKIIVTGSARLDTFRQSGDSLAGRFFTHRLLPFSPAEVQKLQLRSDLNRFLEHSGFPEPFLEESSIEVKRWRNQYIDGLMRTDILDFEKIHDFKAIQLVLELLQRRVGSPISYSSIATDVGVAPNTVKKYLQILESLYLIFRVTPYTKNIARSILKEPKIYFFDPGLVVGDEGAKFENFTGLCLLKSLYAQNDYLGESYKLQYLRTKEGQEVDFCLVNNSELQQILEVKTSQKNISPNLKYFSQKYSVPGIQVVKNLNKEYQNDQIQVRQGASFLQSLYL